MTLFRTLVVVLALCAVSLARKRASRENFMRCSDIGRSGGCAGCENENTGCEWCTLPSDQGHDPDDDYNSRRSANPCAPKGSCWELRDGDEEYVSGGHLCPNDFKKERKLGGRDIEMRDTLRWSRSFDVHYCEFPSQPWTVDRFARAFRNRDPSYHCQLYNDQLPLGQRDDIEALCEVDLDSPRAQECLRRFTEFQCTSACPGYGTATRFNKICNKHCQSLKQVCNIEADCGYGRGNRGTEEECTMYDCLLDQAINTGGVGFACANSEDEDCDDIDLIPTSGQFDYDYCFFGDASRCNAINCQVEEVTTYGPNIGQYACPNPNEDGDDGAGEIVKRDSEQCTPVNPPNAFVGNSVIKLTTSWRITTKPTVRGVSCQSVVLTKMRAKYDIIGSNVEAFCDDELTECIGYASVEQESLPGDVRREDYEDLCFPSPIDCYWD